MLLSPYNRDHIKRVINWLKEFGVEKLVIQMPSDLEYDRSYALNQNGEIQKFWTMIISKLAGKENGLIDRS